MRPLTIGQSELFFIQRGWFNSNNILIRGHDQTVIIDSGHQADAAQTVQLIRAQGLDPGALDLIVNTHCHWDHFGGNHLLGTMGKTKVATSMATAVIFAENDQRAMWLDYFGVHCIIPKVDITWQDGDLVELGGVSFEIIAAPGHAPDAIALYQPDSQMLISADALHDGDCGVLNVAVHGDGVLAAAIETVQRFMTYDIKLVLPGHGPLITDVADSLQRLAARLVAFKKEPVKLAWHFVRRVTMAALMEMQPVSRTDFVVTHVCRLWVEDYAPRCGFTNKERFLTEQIDEFLRRGLLQEADGLLTSVVPR